MKLAPIILFVYNRPKHTRLVLEALKKNELADKSKLFIFSDGPKDTFSDFDKIRQVRNIVRNVNWCKEVIIKEEALNIGLANSVINGVTEIIKKYGSVIVLEDDIVVSRFFLRFMNKCLDLYKDEKRVYGISGYKFPSSKRIKQSTYFLPIMSSWGYATWKDRWETVTFDGNKLLNIVEEKKIDNKLDFGRIKYYQMLKDQVHGLNDSWAVRFYVSMYLKNGLFIFPNKNLVRNIGFDGSGVHCKPSSDTFMKNQFDERNYVRIKKIYVATEEKIVNSFKVVNVKFRKNRLVKLKQTILSFLPPEIKSLIKRKLNIKSKTKPSEFDKLRQFPRYTETSIAINGVEIKIPDSASFLFMYDEIFNTEIYKFKTNNKTPYIIDGGANIGLASIYFKKLYPEAQIIAFEPDPYIYNFLKKNIKNYELNNIELIQRGLWKDDGILEFKAEGADGGLLNVFNDDANVKVQKIEVESLNPYLNKKVDFLKLDIEGAETIVLKNISQNLHNVERIFVEYHSFVNKEQTLDDVIKILTEAKFKLYISAPTAKSNSPFVKINTYLNMDMQLNIYGWKE